MPKLSAKQKKTGGPTKGKKRSAPVPKKQEKKHPPVEEDEIIDVDSPIVEEEEREPEATPMARTAMEVAVPFSDGIAAASLKDLVVILRDGGQEVAFLRSFLRYFATTETFIGSVSSKLSFMKKKGGTLL